jgi:glycosyltransferase involved in cell wall biosynthesis
VCSHIAAAYGTPAVVVFGSTPSMVFGHPTAINLSAGPAKCHPCLIEDRFTNGNRHEEVCPLGGCTQFVAPEYVTQKVRTMLSTKISVCLIVKNEEKSIADCLKSVQDTDEIIILDTGSTDGTEQAITRLNLPTNGRYIKGEYQWKDDFAHARNAALSHCTGDWVLVIDADEVLEPGGIAKLRQAAMGASGRTLFIKLRGEGSQSVHESIRFFKQGVKYVGAAHEAPDTNDGERCDVEICYGYSPTHKLDPDRMLRILSSENVKNPQDTRTLYYLAREYWYRKKYSEAEALFSRYVKMSKFVAERADAYLYLARICWATQRGDEARSACLNAVAINANFKEALLFMATLSFEHNACRWRDFAALATNEKVLFVRC